MVYREADGSAVIGVNSTHAPVRQRFTIAHEIAHLVLHVDMNIHIDDRALVAFRDENSGSANDPQEIEANQFAAALLMPEDLLKKDLKRFDRTDSAEDVIKELADQYDVSVQAMTIRLSTLQMLA